MKKILILLIIFFLPLEVLALEIVYPKTNPAKISADSSFFIGSVKIWDVLFINEQKVPVSELGAFAFPVKLNVGVNSFKLKTDNDSIDFVIERPEIQINEKNNPELIEFPPMKFIVNNDNTPLRKTPIDAGINRISHLEGGTELIITGEKGDFFRVYLSDNEYAWILKKDISPSSACFDKLNEPLKLSIDESKAEFVYKFLIGKKLPYILNQDNESITIYNLNNYKDGIYTISIPIKNSIGYDISYKDDSLILKIKKIPNIDSQMPLKNIIITVDAGHGGSEYGAIGCCNDKEKDINLAIAKQLQSELQNRGAKVVMTRESDIDLSLNDRIKIARANDTHLLLSIHANALPDGGDPLTTRGTSVYYYHDKSKHLAQCILDSMTTQLSTKNDKVRQGSLALVRPTFCISNLIEVAYIINPDDYALLLNPIFQKQCAKAIADGIEKYLTDYLKN